MPPSDEVSIIIGGNALSGWQDVTIRRGCETVPSSFDITATERYPGPAQLDQVAVPAGSPCRLKIGADPVITGYVDQVIPSVSSAAHQIRIQGRSKLGDLVDCSVTPKEVPTMQFTPGSLVGFAQQICGALGISVKSLTGDDVPTVITLGASGGGGTPIPAFNIMLGETGYDVIERVARYLQVLVYDDENGNLIFARAGGGGTMASGFQQGVNVQSARGALSMNQRYSDYLPSFVSYLMFSNQGSGGLPLAPVKDPGVPRYRPLFVVSEQVINDGAIATDRAIWEMNRRLGRSQAITVVCDNWRDSAGTLWQPNAFAQVNVPSLKIAPTSAWVISEVSFSRNAQQGRAATLTLMPPQAFAQEPTISAFPFGWGNPSGAVPGAGAP